MALVPYHDDDRKLGQSAVSGTGTGFIPAFVQVDSTGAEIALGGTAVAASSGDVAAGTAAASLAAVAAKTNYLTGFEITGSGATAASVVLATITGLLGGTQSIVVPVPAGAAVGITPIIVKVDPPHPASAVNTAIAVSLPTLGAGNLHACVNVRGIQK
jgi:hypothetical protein